jgi:hypothetical protein
MLQQYLYDICLVRPFEKSRTSPMDCGGTGQLGHSPFRVSHPGAGQQNRPSGHERRTVENPPGNRDTIRIRSFFIFLSERAAQAGLSLGRFVHPRCGFLYVPPENNRRIKRPQAGEKTGWMQPHLKTEINLGIKKPCLL